MHEPFAKKVLIVTVLILAFIPFLWLKPGEMDLGGDSSRLYFYDPYHYLKYNLLYAIIPTGFNIEQPLILAAPFVALLIFFKTFIQSPYLLITIFNSINLVVAFLSIFGIMQELLSSEKKKYGQALFLASIFTGLYYVFSPIMVRTAWDKALITHSQIFLNPLAFYLLLRYAKTNKAIYILSLLLITVVFSVNFSWASAPILLGFYPFALLFLLLYSKLTNLRFSYLPLLLCGILFAFLQIFHYAPLVVQILDKSGAAFSRTFTSQDQFDIGLTYFLSIVPVITLSENLLGLPQMVPNIIPFKNVFFFVPALLLFGLWLNTKKTLSHSAKTGFILLFGIFLVLLFFVSANITDAGLSFYRLLFKIPGFSMFRNFYGQWMFGYLFFLSLLIGYSFFYLCIMIKGIRIHIVLFLIFSGIVLASAFPFIRGDMINLVLNKGQKKEYKIPIMMDPEYEKVLQYIRSDPVDAKYFSLPFSEGFQQQLAGTQGGMYQGPSTISLLTGHSDFIGYQVMPPFSEVLLALVKNKQYKDVGRLLGLLNVKYVFYNSDDNIMKYFPDFPYQHVKDFFPKDQAEYKQFVRSLPIKKKKDFGDKYHIYTLSDIYYLPPIYVATSITYFENKLDAWGYLTKPFFAGNTSDDPRIVYVEEKKYQQYASKNVPKITFKKINPTKYLVSVDDATSSYVLILSNAFNPNWKVYLSSDSPTKLKSKATFFDGAITESLHEDTFFDTSSLPLLTQSPIAQSRHFRANAYSNGWVITPSDVGNKKSYTLTIEMVSQRIIYVTLGISLVALGLLLGWIIREVRRR